MKRIFLLFTFVTLIGSLAACDDPDTRTVTVPDFVGSAYGDVLAWAKDNDIELDVSSEYNDDVDPRAVISQSVAGGTDIDPDTVLVIVYSRGYDPDGVITVPDFTGSTQDDIVAWLSEVNITKYAFFDTFSPDIDEGGFVGYDVDKADDRDDYLRRDNYTFYFSKGELVIEPVVFDNPGTIRGVNLGGWFVLEGWMAPDLFEGVSGSDETIFMQEKPNAMEAIEEHWNTFIVEDDFAWLAEHGVEYVRLPIPWWLFGEEFSYTHDGVTHNVTYGRSLPYIEQAMEWAETYGINVLLDLHTAPGSQNGFDNGGITDVLQWPRPENVAKTVAVLGDIAEHFSDYDSLWGIQVLNEPGWGVDMTILQNFYVDSYHEVRQHNADVWIAFHDGFRNYLFDSWNNFFTTNQFHNVFFDIHLYQTFGDGWGDYDIFDHVDFVHNEQMQTIARYDGVVPVVIGEWSLGLQGNVYEGLDASGANDVRMAFNNAQMNVYEDAFGWFFWSYKIDRDSHLEWDFRRLIEQDLIPDFYSTE